LNWNDRYQGRLGPCLVIPYFTADGTATGYHRLKPDRPRPDQTNGKAIKYEAPKGMSPLAYFPSGGVTAEALPDPQAALLITEGEKKALKADQEGFACIGLSGVWSWGKGGELLPCLAALPWEGRHVYVVFDDDAATNTNVQRAESALTRALSEKGADVRTIRLPSGPGGVKVGLDDFLVSNAPEALRELLTAPPAEAGAEASALEIPTWPEALKPEAYHGLVGEIVRALGPESEADPAALLLQLLAAFGNVIGRTARFHIEGDDHFLNLFLVLVGQTAKARKGTSWGRIRDPLAQVDSEWAEHRVLSGLSSGEGLIWNVRDPIMSLEKVKKKGLVIETREYESDPGESDKRLLVQEAEFAVVLRQIERQGNTLSAVLRQAWDGLCLRAMTKNSPAKATGAHVSLVGHITAEELRRYLSTTEAASGFGNRFLWACVRRSKCLPEGGRPVDLESHVRRLKEAIVFARSPQVAEPLQLDGDAARAWAQVYPALSEGKPGLAGALIARMEAQALRLACLYALLDLSAQVRPEHLAAALAVVDYCERSVWHIFGESLGDPVADELLRLLRKSSAGQTRTSIRDYFQRNASADQIGRALGLLLQHRLARCEQRQTGGRPEERWFAAFGR
jgi:hypothetical protein